SCSLPRSRCPRGGGAVCLRAPAPGPGARGGRAAAPAAPPPPGPAGGEGDGTGQPGVLTAAETGAPATEVAEAPQPLAGRMTRLRGRLARSQTGFGSVLLSLLSRDGLDEQGWEEIEDTLVGADL